MPQLDAFAPMARIGLAVLLNGLWQGALIAFVTWVALSVFRRANAATRYAVWSLSLLAALVVPVVTSLSRVSVEQPSAITAQHAGSAATTVRTVKRETPPSQPVTAQRATPAQPQTSRFALPSVHVTVPAFIAPAIVGLWLLATFVILIRLIVAFMQLERLKSDSLPLSVEYRDSMPRWMGAIKGARDVRICVSDAIEVPIAVGLFDSMVLLPSHLVHSLDPAEIDQISLHELGHLLRADDWTNAIQRIASALLFFNPAVWFISRQMDVEREVACDDYVLQLTGSVRPYAFCLTKMAEMTAWPHRPMPAPGVFVTRKNISIRIERLLRTGRAIGSSIAPSVAGSVIGALVAVFLVLRMMTPSIAFSSPAPIASIAPVAAIAPVPTIAPVRKIAPATHPHALQKIVVGQIEPAAPAATPSAAAAARVATAPHVRIVAVSAPPVPALPVEKLVHDALAKANIVANADSDKSCMGCNFEGANLSGRDFSNRSMMGANFKNADLRSTRFDGTRMTGANFVDADLRNASFRNADLEGCNMRGARLDGVNFDNARLTGCEIDAGALAPSQARDVLMACEGCNFAHVNLQGMDLHGIRIEGANLNGADLRNVNLSGADLTGVNLNGANLSGANLRGANLTGCNLDGADLRGVDLSHTNLTGANMGNALWKN